MKANWEHEFGAPSAGSARLALRLGSFAPSRCDNHSTLRVPNSALCPWRSSRPATAGCDSPTAPTSPTAPISPTRSLLFSPKFFACNTISQHPSHSSHSSYVSHSRHPTSGTRDPGRSSRKMCDSNFGAWSLEFLWSLVVGRLELRFAYSPRSRRQMGHQIFSPDHNYKMLPRRGPLHKNTTRHNFKFIIL